MKWWEWGLTVVTGGGYAAGKALYNGYKKVTGIADDVEDAAEQAGLAVAKIGDTVVKLGDDLDSLILDIEDLFVIERLTRREDSDLWDEEKERLNDLVEKRKGLKKDIDKLKVQIKTETGVTIPDSYGSSLQKWIIENVMTGPMSWIFGGANTIWSDLGDSGRNKVFKIFGMNSQIIKIDKEIHDILYREPGVLPTTIYNTKEILERFNTIEQPKIEDIMDSVDDNLVESKEILEQVKKLFVIKKKVPVDLTALPAHKVEKLKAFEGEYKIVESAISKDMKVAKQLINLKAQIQPDFLNLGIVKTAKTSNPNVSLKESTDNPVKKENTISIAKEIITLKGDAGPNILKATKQANILKKMTGLTDSKYYAYNSKYALQKAFIKLQERDLSKLKLKIDKIKYKEIEEPGVIPRTLAKYEDILERFNTEEQPRIENILDSINDNLTESKNAINNVNITLEKILGFVDNHNLLLKIFFGITGVAIAITLILIPILIIRMILFGL